MSEKKALSKPKSAPKFAKPADVQAKRKAAPAMQAVTSGAKPRLKMAPAPAQTAKKQKLRVAVEQEEKDEVETETAAETAPAPAQPSATADGGRGKGAQDALRYLLAKATARELYSTTISEREKNGEKQQLRLTASSFNGAVPTLSWLCEICLLFGDSPKLASDLAVARCCFVDMCEDCLTEHCKSVHLSH